jgi:glycosyltransferase involved in cell wall biosynthesis
MRLLIATGLYPPDIGGPATYTVFLEKHLPSHGYTLDVVPFTAVRAYPKVVRHVVYIAKLLKHAWSADVLYALDTVSVGLPVRIVSFITRTPYMLRVPGDYAWEQGQQRGHVSEVLDDYLRNPHQSRFVRLLARIQAHVAQHATHVIAPSEYLKNVVMQWGVLEDRITRIYSVLKEIPIPETKEELRKAFGFGNAFVVSSAGRLVPWKGFHTLIRTVASLKRAGVPVRLEILGDGVCKGELEAIAHELGVEDVVHFRGVLSRDEMAKYIKASDVFVLNTSYEGLSHQLLEVMSLRVPIVTTDVGGNPELIEDGVTGTLLPYNDADALREALVRIHATRNFAHTCAERAYARTELFQESVAIASFIRLMNQLWK